jgi:hypothetical protein
LPNFCLINGVVVLPSYPTHPRHRQLPPNLIIFKAYRFAVWALPSCRLAAPPRSRVLSRPLDNNSCEAILKPSRIAEYSLKICWNETLSASKHVYITMGSTNKTTEMSKNAAMGVWQKTLRPSNGCRALRKHKQQSLVCNDMTRNSVERVKQDFLLS